MHKIISIIIITLLMMSCSSTNTSPYLTSEPIISPKKLDTYWLSTNNIQPLKYMSLSQRKALSGSTVIIKAEYLIDSNGDVFDVEILESNVGTSFSSLVAKSLQSRAFSPSSINTNRQPVVTQSLLTFVCD
ncbi:hypothetical protein [uncultured Paraglaciecola sp.]|jgi:hypothetical protein|uniref:hypothetical protein n=1 Tax=uncultured Paraglaciecola sp. TaxID=1765024 RepID=UPI0025EC5611|nr:hypothetical protein [uncultured Paraglaciecola sp.]